MYLFLFLFEGRPEISRGNYIILKSEVDLDATGQVYQVGAHFKALGKGVLVAPSDLRCIFPPSKFGINPITGSKVMVQKLTFSQENVNFSAITSESVV